ncbi:MAG: ANTAR domain-containing protein [Nocardioidaceae bacterium]
MTSDGPSQATHADLASKYALLAQQYVRLADTLVDDFDVVDVLDELVRACVDLLEVTSAGLLLVDRHGALQLVASSNEATRIVEVYQLQTREGPCVEAVRTSQATVADDLEEMQTKWPRFAATAKSVGFRSVHAFPLRLRKDTIGALNLFSTEVPSLGEDEQRIAQSLADMATIGILQQRSREHSSLLTDQLQTALDSRISIEQAKGVLSEHGKVDMNAAFQSLRTYARDNNLKLRLVAEQVVRRRIPLTQVLPAGNPTS